MGLDLGTLTIQIAANLADFNKSMKGLAASVKANQQGLQAVTVAATGFGVALAAVGVAAVGIAAGFEQGLARVQAVSGATEEQLQSMKTSALEVAAATKFTARESADAMGLLAQAGFDAEQIMAALPGTMQLAAGGMISVESAASIASATLRGMGLAIEDLGRVNDVLVKSAASSNVNVLQLGESLKLVAPVAASAGVELEETVAALSLLGNAGIQASMAGTTLRATFAALLSPSKQVQETLDRLGVQATTAQGTMIPLADVIDQLGEAGATTGDLLTIFGRKAGPGVAALVSQGSDALREMEASLKDAGGTAERIANQQMDTLQGQMLILGSKIEGVAIAFGDIMLPAVRLAVEALQSMTDVFQDLSPEMKKALIVVAGVAAAMAGIVATVGAMLLAVPAMAAAFATMSGVAVLAVAKIAAAVVGLTGSISGMAIALNLALGGIPALTALVVAAIVAVIAAIAVAIDRMGDLIKSDKKRRDALFGTDKEQSAFRKRLAEADKGKAKGPGKGGFVVPTDLFSKYEKRLEVASKRTKELGGSFQELKESTERAFEDVDFEEIGEAMFDDFAPSLAAMDAALGDTTLRVSDFGGMLDGVDPAVFERSLNEFGNRIDAIDISKGMVDLTKGASATGKTLAALAKKITEEGGKLLDGLRAAGITDPVALFTGGISDRFEDAAAGFDAMADEQEAASKAFEKFPSAGNVARLEAAFGSIGTAVAESAMVLEQGIIASGGLFLNTITGALQGLAGDVVAGATAGFQAGGVIGAFVGAIASLLTKINAFEDINNRLNQALGNLLDGLSSLIDVIKPLLDLDLGFIGTVLTFVGAILKTIGLALQAVANLFIDAATFFVQFAESIGVNVGDDIKKLQASRFDAGPEAFAKVWEDFGSDVVGIWDGGLSKTKSNIAKDVVDSSKDLAASFADALSPAGFQQDFAMDAGLAGGALGDLASAAGMATENLLNVPTGFDLIAARRAATGGAGDFIDSGTGGGGGAGESLGIGAKLSIATLLVLADDPEELFDKLAELNEDRDFTNSGAGTDSGGEFSVPQTTGENP